MTPTSRSILVIEHEALMLTMFQIILKYYGYTVISHLRSDNQTDFDYVQATQPCLIILGKVGGQRGTDLHQPVSVHPLPNATDTFRCITLSNFPTPLAEAVDECCKNCFD